ncbi:MAG: BACON domain-containing protein [Bacteroidales bacterium]|nr:BACON domain-containing protein [Bacteroidales bacterium]
MKIIRQFILILASLAMLSSCLNEEEKLVATAIMTDKSSLEFGIEDTLALALTVYADAPWTVETPSWVTVDPATGDAGETVVTVVVEPNVRENLPDRPRQDVLKFVGQDIYANAFVDILQAGDKYRDLVELTMAEALALETDTFVGVKDVQVVALASNGFIAQDQTALSYVAADLEVELGDKGNVYAYVSSLNDLPSLAKGDKFVKASNSAVDYSSAKDITAELQAYKASQIELVSITGKYASKKIELYYEEGAERPSQPDSVVIEVMNPHESLALSQYDGWLVEAKGYTVGQGTNVVYFVPVEVKGVKSLETIYYSDDFSWIAPMSAADAAGDAVGTNNPSTTAPNVWKMTSSQDFFNKFNEIGYQYLWGTVGDSEFKLGPEQAPNGSVGKDGSMYIQKDYLKFGQTSYNGALRLPALSAIPGQVNIVIDFDWCWQVTGSYNPDIMTLTVESSNGKFEQTGTAVSQNLESAQSQEAEKSKIEWQHVSIVLTEATPETVLTIRPTYADPDKQNKARHQNRWYLDNIKIIEYTGSVSVAEPTEAEVTISMENNIIFEAAQTEPITFEFQSDQEATLTVGADWAFFIDADDKEVSSLTIAASTPTTVKVGAKEHTESEPRTTEITIESGLTVETIPVKQMSPGQKVEPFVSFVGGNSNKVNFEEGTFIVTVQGNIEFQVEDDASWVTVEAVPETRATVEFKSYVVAYEANSDPAERIARIRAFNADQNLESVYTLVQGPYETGIYYQDDFSWVAPWADAYGADDSVGDNNASGKAPNVYSHETHLEGGVPGYPAFLTEYANRGYEDVNAAGKSFYTQKYYLKFGKTSVHTGLKLPANDFEGTAPADVELSFDWAAHMTGKGVIDKVNIVVELEGDGVCGDSGAKISNPFTTTQPEGKLEWQKASLVLKGVTSATRIIIRPTVLDDSDGVTQKRWYIDNIKLAKPTFLFSDDFSWVAPWADAYGADDSVGDNNASGKAPNVYSHETHLEGGVPGYPAFLTEYANRGYEDVNAAGKSFYTQKYYLKFGKTSVHTGLKLPALEVADATDVDLSFNWAAHMTGKGVIDKVNIVVELEGDGVCGDTGTKISNPFTTTQPEGKLEWQNASLILKGVTSATRIIIRPTVLDDSDGVTQKRWYIDNIRIY